jgi:hypothetical protein
MLKFGLVAIDDSLGKGWRTGPSNGYVRLLLVNAIISADSPGIVFVSKLSHELRLEDCHRRETVFLVRREIFI